MVLFTYLEMFMYVPLAALTTQTTEGTVGSSLSVNVLNTTATIGELISWLTLKFAKTVDFSLKI